MDDCLTTFTTTSFCDYLFCSLYNIATDRIRQRYPAPNSANEWQHQPIYLQYLRTITDVLLYAYLLQTHTHTHTHKNTDIASFGARKKKTREEAVIIFLFRYTMGEAPFMVFVHSNMGMIQRQTGKRGPAYPGSGGHNKRGRGQHVRNTKRGNGYQTNPARI